MCASPLKPKDAMRPIILWHPSQATVFSTESFAETGIAFEFQLRAKERAATTADQTGEDGGREKNFHFRKPAQEASSGITCNQPTNQPNERTDISLLEE